MTTTLEREIKLRFDDHAGARAAILAIGATPLRGRRLQEDCLLDTGDEVFHRRRCVLRLRIEPGRSLLTFKGPVQPSPMKLREEVETVVADGDAMLRMLQEMGLAVWFRYQKYREEFSCADAILALDETPIGTFVEIEGGEHAITETAAALGRTSGDYLLDSYRSLFCQERAAHGMACTEMIFEEG